MNHLLNTSYLLNERIWTYGPWDWEQEIEMGQETNWWEGCLSICFAFCLFVVVVAVVFLAKNWKCLWPHWQFCPCLRPKMSEMFKSKYLWFLSEQKPGILGGRETCVISLPLNECSWQKTPCKNTIKTEKSHVDTSWLDRWSWPANLSFSPCLTQVSGGALRSP